MLAGYYLLSFLFSLLPSYATDRVRHPIESTDRQTERTQPSPTQQNKKTKQTLLNPLPPPFQNKPKTTKSSSRQLTSPQRPPGSGTPPPGSGPSGAAGRPAWAAARGRPRTPRTGASRRRVPARCGGSGGPPPGPWPVGEGGFWCGVGGLGVVWDVEFTLSRAEPTTLSINGGAYLSYIYIYTSIHPSTILPCLPFPFFAYLVVEPHLLKGLEGVGAHHLRPLVREVARAVF